MDCNNIKICHFTSVHQSQDVRIFEKECLSLCKGGYNVYLVSPGNRSQTYQEQGVIIVNVLPKFKNRFWRMIVFSKSIYKAALSIDADLYHFHDPELIKFGLKLKKLGKKVIFDCHEDIFDNLNDKDYIPKLFRPIFSYIINLYQKKSLKKFDSIISVSPHIVEKITPLNKNVVMITNFPKNIDLNINHEKQFDKIIFAGGISEQWNHHKIIEALEYCENVNYNLCGIGSSEYLNKLRQIRGWNKVNYYGKLSKSDADKLLYESSIGIAILSYNRNVGMNYGTLGNTKLFEYMMAALPIICTDFILWKEIIDRFKCGIYVNPNDIHAIIDAINFLKNNPSIAYKMGINGRRAFEVEYNWHSQEQKLMDLYKSILTK